MSAEAQAFRTDRNAGTAATLYPPETQISANAVRDLILAGNPAGFESDMAQQQVEMRAVAADLGLTSDDLSTMAMAVRQNTLNPPTPEVLAAHARASVQALRERYGVGGFDQAVRNAQALARVHPHFQKYLSQTGLEVHPTMVLRMAELGAKARAKGLIR